MALPSLQPETELSYWERKNEELALLRRHLGDGPAALVDSGVDLLQEKLLLRARMIARYIESNPFMTESNLTGDHSLPFDGSILDFSYQRYDMSVLRKPFGTWIYPTLASQQACSLGFLAGSGMSALCAVLTSLDLAMVESRSLYMAHDNYYETRDFAAKYLYQLKGEYELPGELDYKGVLLLDSISRTDPLDWLGSRTLGWLAAVVLDTTCYDVAAPEIERVVERCLAEGMPCVLVRSHMKVDTLGLEYGRLGSIVVVLPRPCDGRRSGFVKRLRNRIIDFISKTGTGFSPHQYFPLTSDPTFRRLNEQRNAIMRHNNLRSAAALCAAVHERSATRIRTYHHGRFFFLQPTPDDWSASFARAVRDALLEVGVYARIAPSFAYDFLSITRITGQQYQSKGGLRISVPDYPSDAIDRLIEALTRLCIDLAPTSAG